ncbi:heavy-metal-associated domain-containing protein [Methylobacterium durans]|uniref:heavy-metal-associated domain-containing protein n=1 Tax=Methylobacterium durans TaxID=2202825 RepID=UPI001F48849D|nr:heavy-metal-associated domain-containing protein [Methylobacterium durans]
MVLRVDDMTCGHCAGAIQAAVEGDLPGTQAAADPATKTVTVRGTADAAAVGRAVKSAGYTPSSGA